MQSGVTVALNWWYDAELRGMSWIMLNFLRNPVGMLPADDDDKEYTNRNSTRPSIDPSFGDGD